MKINFKLLYCCLLLINLSACIAPEELQNFNQGPAFPDQPVDITAKSEILIQSDDEISISVYAFDQLAAAPFNITSSISDGNLSAASGNISTYLVDQDGYIDFPELGRIQLAGLTIEQAKTALIEKLKTYIKNPIVNIRFTNFRITVIGEVKQPATFTFPDEKVTILEAIGMAGDLTSYGNRTDILIIREQNGQREFGHVNLRDRQVFQSPYFYLKQNDVVYVYPIKDKTATVNSQAQRIIPWVATLTTLATFIISLTR